MSPAEGYKVSMWEDRLKKLTVPTRYKETYTKKLLKYCILSTYRPQRFTILSSFEEKLRCQLSWMMFDRLMYLAAFGTAEQLAKHVALVIEFELNRHNTVIVQADHMPIWLRLGSRAALFADWEKQNTQDIAHLKCGHAQ